MRFESFSALRGCLKNSPWLSSDKTFVAYDISQFFQGTGMTGKVAVGQCELFFQATSQGREAFKSHIEALEQFLKSK